MPSRESKAAYFEHMNTLLQTYKKIAVVHCDFVGSKQFAQIRRSLRGEAVVLMGKNTMMRKIITEFLKENKGHPIEALIPLIIGNVGLIFTNGSLSTLSEAIIANRVPAMAKAGVIAECDVIIPPGPTGCDPGQTSWFQALNVPTKISKGQIEIVSELKIVTKGEKVGPSEAGLLQKLEINPFTYGLILTTVYDDGSVYPAAVLAITDETLTTKFAVATRRVAAISREIGIPTLASLPHALGVAVKRMIAIASQTGYKFKFAEPWGDALYPAAPVEAAAPAEE